jgi:endonuclease YncB( thermonuclease family)
MKKKLNRTLLAALSLSVALACGGSAATQTAKSSPTPAPKEDCAPWPQVVNAAYLQVLERPAHGEGLKEATEKLMRGEMTVRELVAQLAASDEYKERFVASRSAEEAAGSLYKHILGRDAQPSELKSAAASSAAAKGFGGVARSLVEGDEYGRRFGSSKVPGASGSMRPCRFPLKLNRTDDFGDGREMKTELSVEADGKFRAKTTVKGASGTSNSTRASAFCGKVGLWLLDEGGRAVVITGPPAEAQWCAGGAEPEAKTEHVEEWEGSLPRPALDAAGYAAIMQRAAGNEPQRATRENAERAAQIKQPVR